jgi:NADH dehydrogenase (ubiquinone) Fe-S protein 1
MTRCIQCTRCIRFANEVAGVSELGTSGRGNQIEIGTYVDKLLKSEFSGNLIDLCPVGALTSKPYAFAARSWELKSIESIDTLDAVCSNIRVDVRGYEVLRVLPSTNEELNESWLNDKSRFSFDGLKRQRLCDPLLRRNGGFVQISWLEAFNIINDKLKTSKPQINGLVGSQADLESSFMLKILLSFFGKTNILNNNYNMLEHTDFESSYKFNSKIKGIENCDVCVLIGVDPRKEASILNLKLRKHYLNSNFKVANFGSVLNLTFPCLHLGSSSTDILKFTKGQHLFCETFKKATQPYIIFGSSFFKILNEESARSIITVISKNTRILYKDSFGFNFLSFQASQVGSFDLGLSTNNIYSKPTLMYAVGDAIIPSNVSKTSFIVYQGHQGNFNALKADLILPGSAYTEKDCIFINTEGRAQKTQKIVRSPGKSKNDASILSALINFISKQKIVVNLKLLEIEHYNVVFNAFFTDRQTRVNGVFKNSVIISSKLNNFYLSDSISKASPTMAKCSKQLLSKDSLLI